VLPLSMPVLEIRISSTAQETVLCIVISWDRRIYTASACACTYVRRWQMLMASVNTVSSLKQSASITGTIHCSCVGELFVCVGDSYIRTMSFKLWSTVEWHNRHIWPPRPGCSSQPHQCNQRR